MLHFCNWSWPQNYFNSEIFPIYGMWFFYLNIVLILWYSVLSLAIPSSPSEVRERLSDWESLETIPLPLSVSSEGWSSGGLEVAVCSPSGCFFDSPSPSSSLVADELLVEDFAQKESDSCRLCFVGSFNPGAASAGVGILLSERFREWERGFWGIVACVCTGAVEWLLSEWLLDVFWLATRDKSGLKLGVCSRPGDGIEASFGVITSEPLDAPSPSVVGRGVSWGEWPSFMMVSFLLLYALTAASVFSRLHLYK